MLQHERGRWFVNRIVSLSRHKDILVRHGHVRLVVSNSEAIALH